ncbi:carbohydrate ABC transporter permease [Pseudoclostridium thermosuccinogenes]|uniref:carbohydrate ABC transporter permease n=1 Tax=Clostridium thermosuccinogenes TaxID=84032 RepID=UPI001FA8C401|nr:carbohydrate ABC transporter permease [Pseudoclostridium thermosuccinogenes]
MGIKTASALRVISRRRIRRPNRSLEVDILMTMVLGAFGLFSAWPLIYVINNAFKPLNEIFLFPPRLFVQNPTFNNFKDLFTIIGNSWIPFSRYIFNTVFITTAGTLGTVFVGSMAAFPLAKYKFPGSKVMSSLIVYSLMFSSSVTAIPNYIIMSKLGMIDSYWAVIIPAIGSTLGLYLMKNNIVQIPDSLLEASKMDGASEFKIYFSIIMPLSKPAWITLIVLSFQSLWGTTGGTFIYAEKLKPVSYALSQIVSAGVARTGVASAVSLIMLVVPVTVFIISQSNVIETMATSGMK